MQFDPVSQRVVLFGGANAGDNRAPFSDTWIWDGRRWAQASIAQSAQPAPRWGAPLAASGPNGHLVLIGGSTAEHGGASVSDSWEWDGSRWVNGGAMPSSLESQASGGLSAATNPTTKETLIAGGVSNGDCQTFIWGAGRGFSQEPAPHPCLFDVGLAFDGTTGTGILFGGYVNPGEQRQATWLWNGTTWMSTPTRSSPAAGPASAAWDAATGQLMLLDSAGQTWIWKGGDWQFATAAGPGRRDMPSIAYDAAHHVVVLFGGHDPTGPTLNDMWAWDGVAWHVLGSG